MAAGLSNIEAVSAKMNSSMAEGRVKAVQAARPPASPLPRSTPSAKPTWLEAGPGMNCDRATRSA